MLKYIIVFVLISTPVISQTNRSPMMPQSGPSIGDILEKVYVLGAQAGSNFSEELARRDALHEEKLKWVLDNWVHK